MENYGMAEKTKQENSNISDSQIQQIKVDTLIVNGVTEEKCRQICLDVYKNNIMEFQKEAQDKAFSRASELTDIFIEKLSTQDEKIRQKVEECLKEPAMQEAVFKSQKCYAMSNDEDHLNILTNMLIDRGNISQRTNKQMLIDDAIDTLSKLNQKHLDILGYILLRGGVNQSGTLNILDSYINNLVKYMKKIIPLSKENNDFVYLKHRNCLQTPVFSDYQGIETYIFRQTQAFNEGFEKSEILEELNNNAFENFFIPSLKNPNKYVLKFNSFEFIEKHLSQDELLQALEKIKKFYIPYKSGQVNKSEVYDIILKRHPDASILFNNDIKAFSYYNLTPLGQLIAIEYVSQDVDKDFLWDFE